MRSTLFLLLVLNAYCTKAQIALFQRKGELRNTNGVVFQYRLKGLHKIEIKDCPDSNIRNVLTVLALARHGRRAIRQMAKSNSILSFEVSHRIALAKSRGQYGLVAGVTGPVEASPNILNRPWLHVINMLMRTSFSVETYAENRIRLYPGSIAYYYQGVPDLIANNCYLIDLDNAEEIRDFSTDSIVIQPIKYPDLLYKNILELYYLAGIHEITHISSKNYELQINGENPEELPFKVEIKARKQLKRVYRRAQKLPNYQHLLSLKTA